MNVGKIERIIRFVLGIVILSIGGYYENYWGLLGLIPLLTGLVGFCPLYFLKKKMKPYCPICKLKNGKNSCS